MANSFAIIYQRPDGWWLAGDGFVSRRDALESGERHDWNGTPWKVVLSGELDFLLCEEAKEAFDDT